MRKDKNMEMISTNGNDTLKSLERIGEITDLKYTTKAMNYRFIIHNWKKIGQYLEQLHKDISIDANYLYFNTKRIETGIDVYITMKNFFFDEEYRTFIKHNKPPEILNLLCIIIKIEVTKSHASTFSFLLKHYSECLFSTNGKYENFFLDLAKKSRNQQFIQCVFVWQFKQQAKDKKNDEMISDNILFIKTYVNECFKYETSKELKEIKRVLEPLSKQSNINQMINTILKCKFIAQNRASKFTQKIQFITKTPIFSYLFGTQTHLSSLDKFYHTLSNLTLNDDKIFEDLRKYLIKFKQSVKRSFGDEETYDDYRKLYK